MASAIEESQDVIVGDLLHEPNTTRAEDTSFVIEDDARTNIDPLWLLDLLFDKARFPVAKFNRKLLKSAFAGLVADRTIERMIDEEKFHHPLAAFLGERRVCAHRHALTDLGCAGDRRARAPSDRRTAVGAKHRLAFRSHFWHAQFNEAHAAVPRRA